MRPDHWYLDDPTRNPPLGLLYVATAAARWAKGWEVRVLEMNGVDDGDWFEEVPEAEVFAFTAVSADYRWCEGMARFVKARDPRAVTVIGGVHATLTPPERIGPAFDVVVRGEGETAIARILDGVARGEVRAGGRRVVEGERIKDLDRVPVPDRSLLPRSSVVSPYLLAGKTATTHLNSRGCPFKCTFCASPGMWGDRVTWHSAGYIRAELEGLIRDYGVDGIKNYDDNFTIARGKLMAVLLPIYRDLGLAVQAQARVRQVDPEMLRECRRSGVEELAVGVESVTQEALDSVLKGLRVEDVFETVRMIEGEGIRCRAFMILGLPGESRDVVERTRRFLEECRPSFVRMFTFTPYPGTHLHDMIASGRAEKAGLSVVPGADIWDLYGLGHSVNFIKAKTVLPVTVPLGWSLDEFMRIREDLLLMIAEYQEGMLVRYGEGHLTARRIID